MTCRSSQIESNFAGSIWKGLAHLKTRCGGTMAMVSASGWMHLLWRIPLRPHQLVLFKWLKVCRRASTSHFRFILYVRVCFTGRGDNTYFWGLLAVLMDKGIIIGVEHEIATRGSLPFVMFRLVPTVGFLRIPRHIPPLSIR
jgi:hypothetical protein